jgi:DNA-binding NarL/FixJ family response regulator
MPGGNGLSVLQDARRSNPRIPVLVLSSAPEEQLGLSVLRAGASGYLAKQTATKHLVAAVLKVLQGGKYISATLAEQLADEAEKGGQPLHEKLSRRELQVLHLLVSGRSLKEIAWDLSLDVNTVRTFRVRLLEKLRLKCDVDLVHYALEHGLVEKHLVPRFPPA